MSLLNDELLGAKTNRVHHAGFASCRNICDVLDEFVRDLEYCDTLVMQLQCVMKAITAGIQADAVFTHSVSDGSPTNILSDRPLSSTWRRRFAEQQLKTFATHRHSYCC